MPEKLREYRMMFERVPAGEAAVPDPDKLGIRSKLGGEPDWCQNPEVPDCPACKSLMSFVGQLDSIEHKESHNPNQMPYKEQQYMFGDVGMIYLFICFDCNETKSIIQFG
jgi:hypothetical protein